MWDYKTTSIDASTVQYQVLKKGERLAFEEVLTLWQSSPEFRLFYHQMLAASNFRAYFWEHPPISSLNLNRPYEFVLIDSPILAGVRAEPTVFAAHFQGDQSAVSFRNLGRDAQLIVPAPFGELAYPHLASFCHYAPTSQLHDFWTLAGRIVTQYLTASPRWLSTSGLGVFWLHLRLDERPKYYHHQIYRQLQY